MKRLNLFSLLLVLFLIGMISQNAGAALLFQSPETLTARADAIVHGWITKVEFHQDLDGTINTDVSVYATDVLKGSAPQVFTFTVPGGIIEAKTMFVTGLPDFQAGENVLLFLDESLSRLIGRAQGKWTLASGLVLEMMADSDLALEAVADMAAGRTPGIDLSGYSFQPISQEEGLLRRLSDFAKYSYDGWKWTGHSVTLKINENCAEASGEGNAIRAAMDAWNSAPANFAFIDGGTHSHTQSTQNFVNEAMWNNGSYEDAIAYAQCWTDYSNLVECDLVFLYDNSYSWSTNDNPGNSQMDVQNISTHELGHFLQLLDLYNDNDWEKTMYGYASPGETNKRSLHQDDKNGIVYIYGSGAGDDDDDDDDTPSPDDDDDDTPNPDDDDDNGADDDDSDDDDFEDDVNDCTDLLNLIYNDCDTAILKSGEEMPGQVAYDLCREDDGPWDCLFECAAHESVDSCSTFASCLEQMCNVALAESTGSVGDDDDDDDSSGGFCG